MKQDLLAIGIIALLSSIPISFAVRIPADRVLANRETPYLAQTDTLPDLQDVLSFPSSAGEVEFPHLAHVEDFGLDCETCHHEINAAALDIPHEAYFEDLWIDCTICHREAGSATLQAQACSNCHHVRPSEMADQTLSAKVVIHKNCWECHESGTGEEASRQCKFCHTGPRTTFSQAPVRPGENR